MSDKNNALFTDYLRRPGDNRPDHERFINVNPPPTQEQIDHLRSIQIPKAPPSAPHTKTGATFSSIKTIILNDDNLTAEQKCRLITNIGLLY